MLDLDELQKLAEAATLGPWTHQPYGPQNQNGDYSGGEVFDGHGEYLFHDVRDEDGEFLVAAQPQVILELIERVREVEAERDYANDSDNVGAFVDSLTDALQARQVPLCLTPSWDQEQQHSRP